MQKFLSPNVGQIVRTVRHTSQHSQLYSSTATEHGDQRGTKTWSGRRLRRSWRWTSRRRRTVASKTLVESTNYNHVYNEQT